LSTSPLGEWLEHFSSVIAAVEFAPSWKNAYDVGFQTMVTINVLH
jgi:hypothetical protein